jgi:DNA ligase 1
MPSPLFADPLRRSKKRPVGIIELGVPPKHRMAFCGIAKQLVTGENKIFVYLEPGIRAKVK